MEFDEDNFLPRRSGALRKGSTLPSKLNGVAGETTVVPDANETTEPFQDIRRRKGHSLTMTRPAAICPTYDNIRIEDDVYDEIDDYDDFTDDDEIIYENPVTLVDDLQALEKKREDVAREILYTEHIYLEKLTFLRLVKRQLESMNSVKNIFPPDEIDRMFPCIESLFQLHMSVKFSLEQTLRIWKHDSSLASAFIPRLLDFKVYVEFIKSYPLSVKTIETWKARDERFDKLITIFQQHSPVCLISLFDVMHEPYIRLQRMKLLFERYAKCLNQKEREYQNIKRILNAIDSILSECEVNMQTADDLETLLKLAERIDGVLEHFANDTRLVKEGSVIEVDPRGKKAFTKLEKHIHLYLFHGFLLICSPVETTKKQLIKSKVKMSALKILSCDFLNSMSYNAESSFILQTPSIARLLVCPSAKEANQWKEAFNDTISKAANRPSFKKQLSIGPMDFSCAPVWIPDDCVNACMLCLEKFTLIRRRHHCRGCGIIICSSCSPGKLLLPYSNFTAERVCRKCYRRAGKHKRELLCVSKQGKDTGLSCEEDRNSLSTQTTIKINSTEESIGEEEI